MVTAFRTSTYGSACSARSHSPHSRSRRPRADREHARQGARRSDARPSHRGVVSGRRRGLLPRHGRRPAAHQEQKCRAATCGWSGPAATIASGTAIGVTVSAPRFPEDAVVASDAAATAATTAGDVSRPRQRALLQEGRPDPDPNRFGLWLDVRDPSCPPDPFANADRNTRACRSARAGRPCRSAPTTANPPGIVGLRLFPESGLRRERAQEAGTRSAIYNDPRYYFDRRPGSALPRRHVVRVLSRRTESDQSAGRPREPEVGEPELQRRRAVLLGRPHLQLAGRRQRRSFFYQLLHTSRPGTLDTSLVSTDNINNPRTMNAVYHLGRAHGAGEEVGQGDARRRRAEQQAVQRLRPARRSADAVLRAAATRSGRRVC